MRKEFINCSCRKTAWLRAPWACKVVLVCGGFIAFESMSDYLIYKAQK